MADLQAAVAIDPSNADGWYQLGLLQGQILDLRGAEASFRRSLELRPDFAPAHYSLALTVTANPQYKLDWPEAIREIREALKSSPDYAEALNLLGAGLTNTGETAAAIPELKHAIRIKPSFAAAHFSLAIALERSDRLDEAAKEYRLAVAAKGSYPEATTALGKLLLRMGKLTEAEQELNEAQRRNPDFAQAHFTLARVLEILHKTREAHIEADEAKSLAQREADAAQSSVLSNTGLELAPKGDLAGASASLRKAITLKPDNGVPHFNLGLILADAGDLAGAVRELTKAISLMPGQAKPWFSLGRVLERQGDRNAAFAAVVWAAQLAPFDGAVREELASLRKSRGAAGRKSEPIGQPVVGALSDTAEDHFRFARELNTQGDALGAVGELLRALALRPDDLPARLLLADAYAKLGDRDHAILEYYKLFRMKPADANLHIACGEALLARGDTREAAEEFRSALLYRRGSAQAHAGLARATRAASKQ